MKNSLDVRLLLQAFNIVTAKGQLNDGVYSLDSVEAFTDFDGYTCFLKYQQVMVTLMFHNKYQVDSPSEEALERFERRLNKLLKYQ